MSQVIVKTSGELYRTEIISGNHTIIADEPVNLGGGNLGPNPYDLLLSAVGACVGMTLRMYAERKKWDLQEVHVHLSQERIHAKDCTDCKSEEGYVHIIKKELKLIGDLTEKQLDRLKQISDRCPVQKTLMNEVKFKTSLAALT
ncbi:MAG: OsmC family protein [Saprospiraceae bacterium]|nr:OsmC family protein [Saprospiraceae bacterium]